MISANITFRVLRKRDRVHRLPRRVRARIIQERNVSVRGTRDVALQDECVGCCHCRVFKFNTPAYAPQDHLICSRTRIMPKGNRPGHRVQDAAQSAARNHVFARARVQDMPPRRV